MVNYGGIAFGQGQITDGTLMRAMILAAGMGKRMQPLTADIPKPLLKVGDKSLIEHQILRLIEGGITGVVINHFYLGAMIEDALGSGSRFGIDISDSREPIQLETACGIIKSLSKLKDDSFIVVNADIWTNFDFSTLKALDGKNELAHLVLVENRDHNPEGDFYLDESGRVHENSDLADSCRTFSGISVMHKKLFEGLPIKPLSTVPLLRKAMGQNKVSGELYTGLWVDVGTPERLQHVKSLQMEEQS